MLGLGHFWNNGNISSNDFPIINKEFAICIYSNGEQD